MSDTIVDIQEASRSDFVVGATIGGREFLHHDGDFWGVHNPFVSTPIDEMSDLDRAHLFDEMTERSFMDNTRMNPSAVSLPAPRYAPGSTVRHDQRDGIEAMIQNHFAENVLLIEGRVMVRKLPPLIRAMPKTDDGRWFFSLETGNSLTRRDIGLFSLLLYPTLDTVAEVTGQILDAQNCAAREMRLLSQLELHQDGGFDRLPKHTMLLLALDVHSRLERLKRDFVWHPTSQNPLLKEIGDRLYLPLPKIDEQAIDTLHASCTKALTLYGTDLYPEWQHAIVRKALTDWQDRPMETLAIRQSLSRPSL
jgi:hypothetical protein